MKLAFLQSRLNAACKKPLRDDQNRVSLMIIVSHAVPAQGSSHTGDLARVQVPRADGEAFAIWMVRVSAVPRIC